MKEGTKVIQGEIDLSNKEKQYRFKTGVQTGFLKICTAVFKGSVSFVI